jgi:hypothetical protein
MSPEKGYTLPATEEPQNSGTLFLTPERWFSGSEAGNYFVAWQFS